jgi:glycerophosphoryl diester phosphodiesterase
MADPIFIEHNGHRTWLKWHRGRRRAADPVFTGARILQGMQLGASVEIDLVIHADHGMAVLHDLTLERETTGQGAVRETSATQLRQLFLRDNQGHPLPDRVMLLDDLCTLLDRDRPHPEALLQLDFKEDNAALDDLTVRAFGAQVGRHGRNMILSSGDAEAVSRLAEAAPGLRTGYDPCHGAFLDQLQADGDYAAFTRQALSAAPEAELIYLHYELVLAAARSGFDIIGAIHAAQRRVDAYTIQTVDAGSLQKVRDLLALKVDQITTDDPEGLFAAITA